MGERNRQEYLKLKDFVALSGLSESTIRRRVRDGSLATVQIGGKGKKLLFRTDALEEVDSNVRSELCDTNPDCSGLSENTGAPADIPSGPRWARSLPRNPK